MATFTGAKHAYCVFLFQETKSKTMFSVDFEPSMVRILLAGQQFILGTKKFVRGGCSVTHFKRTDRSRTVEAVVEQMRDSFALRPRK
ncbi:hypothetical protein C0J52_19659 [Blattella germanica]|nr:hypothetical protein C0J52_19659 [Blattella germanica]